jgi:hypothetical protein
MWRMPNAIQRLAFDRNTIKHEQQRGNETGSELPEVPHDAYHVFRLLDLGIVLRVVPHDMKSQTAIEHNADLRNITAADWMKDEIITALIIGKAT